MTKEEIQTLGNLSRISLTEAEIERFQVEIDAILGYVGAINEIVADNSLTKTVGAVHNVFRDDVVTNESGQHTEVITKAFPETDGEYLKVKKILNPDN